MDNGLIIQNTNLLQEFMQKALQTELAPALNELWVFQIDQFQDKTAIELIKTFSRLDDTVQRGTSYNEAIERGYALIEMAGKGTPASCMFISAVNIPGMGLTTERDTSMSSLGVIGGMVSKGRNYPSVFTVMVNDGVFSMVDGFFRPWMLAVSAKSIKNKALKTILTCVHFERDGDKFSERKRYTFRGCCPIDIKGTETTYTASSNPKQLQIDFMFDSMTTDVTYKPYDSKKHNSEDELEKKLQTSVQTKSPVVLEVQGNANNENYDNEKFKSWDDWKKVHANLADNQAFQSGDKTLGKIVNPTQKYTKYFNKVQFIDIHSTNLSNIIDPLDIVRVSKYIKYLRIVSFLKAPGVTYLIKMLIDEGFAKIVNRFRLPDTINYADPAVRPKIVVPIKNDVVNIQEEVLNISSRNVSIDGNDSNPVPAFKTVGIGDNDSNPYSTFKSVEIGGNDSNPVQKHQEVLPNALDTTVKFKNTQKDIKMDETFVKLVKTPQDNLVFDSIDTKKITVKRIDTPLF